MSRVFDLSVLYPFVPELVVFFGAIVCLLTDLFSTKNTYRTVSFISFFTLILSAYFLFLYNRFDFAVQSPLFEQDAANFPLRFLILLIAFLVLCISDFFLNRQTIHYAEYHFLILTATFSFMMVVLSSNIVVLLLALETGSFCSYILCGLKRSAQDSVESALKYFLSGAVGAAFFLYGYALVYGATGFMDLPQAFSDPSVISGQNGLFSVGLFFIVIGLLVKLAVMPVHFWAPDVYRGAPTVVTAFISTVPKIALLWLLLDILALADGNYLPIKMLTAMAGLVSVVLGAVFAWRQANIKNLMAYSSITQIGYLISIASLGDPVPYADVYFYLSVYAISVVGFFGCLALLEKPSVHNSGLKIDALRGLFFSQRSIAVAMCVFLMSMTGLPLTAGFIGKLRVYSAVFSSESLFAALVVLVGSMLSAYYYMKVIFTICSKPQAASAEADSVVGLPFYPKAFFGILLSLSLTVLLGFFPHLFLMLGTIAGN